MSATKRDRLWHPSLDPAPVPPSLALVEVTPTLVGDAAPSLDDTNPRNLPIYHGRGCPIPDDCRPRVQARCRGCRRRFVLCFPSKAGIDAMKRGGWRCAECEREVTP